jgi:hypothetical protein
MTNGNSMFISCKALTAIPSSFGSTWTAMTTGSSMFYSCTSLTAIPSSFGSTWTALTDGSGMFISCVALTAIPSNFGSKWTALTNGNGMFYNCTSLKTAYFLAPSCTTIASMFDTCTALESITLTPTAYTALINGTSDYGLTSAQLANAKLYSESPTVLVIKTNKGMSKYFFAV